jgi:hypothetical protein
MAKKSVEWAMHHKDVLGAGANKRTHLTNEDRFRAVMKEFMRGTLNSGSGKKVKNQKQALAIAYSEKGKKK